MFGVGNGSLSLPLPTTMPETLRELMQHCWHNDPIHRPTFASILCHIDNSFGELNRILPKEFSQWQKQWKLQVQKSQSKSRASLHSNKSLGGCDIANQSSACV